MCSPAEFWSTALVVVLIGAVAVNAVLQHQFLVRLQRQHPSFWQELGKRKVWTDDGNTNYAAAQLCLLAGEYTALPDPSLVLQGHRARKAFFISAAVLVVWGAIGVMAGAWPRLWCLVGGSS